MPLPNHEFYPDQEFKNKPVSDWTMWDAYCHDFYQMCEEHDKLLAQDEEAA